MKWLLNLHKSKTMVFNVLVAIFAVIEINMNLLQGYLGEHYGVAFMFIAVVNAVLRIITTQPLDKK